MKTILNKKIKVTTSNDEGTVDMTYAELIDTCIKYVSPNSGGLTYPIMKSIGRVEPLLVKEKETIELEDADFAFVKSKVISMTWAFYSKEFLEFQEYIESVDLVK